MSLLDPLPWDTKVPPSFVNPEGVKWWPDHDSTKWATREDVQGTTLSDVTAWFTLYPDGEKTRVLVINGQVEFASSRMEDIAVHIDILKVAKRYAEQDKLTKASSTSRGRGAEPQ